MSNVEPKEILRGALIELVNKQIKQTGVTPEEAAQFFAEEAKAALDHLGWKPHVQRAASEHLVVAVACLKDGRVIPVPNFDVLFPEAKQHRVLVDLDRSTATLQ